MSSYCGKCVFLNPTESEQKKDEPHMCGLLNRCLGHEGHHPFLPRPDDCPFSVGSKLISRKHGFEVDVVGETESSILCMSQPADFAAAVLKKYVFDYYELIEVCDECRGIGEVGYDTDDPQTCPKCGGI